MEDISGLERIALKARGGLYSLLHFTSDRLIIGTSIRGWITFLLFLLALFLGFSKQSIGWFILGMTMLVAVRALYWKARRDGYIVFKELKGDLGRDIEREIGDYQKLSVRTSGLFCVVGWEEDLLHHPAQLWRVPVGDYVVMIRQANGRHLYQFVEVGFVRRLRAGCLVIGAHEVPALEINFRTTWGSKAGESDFNWFSPNEGSETKRFQRTVYVGFENQPERDMIGSMLQEDNVESLETAA